MNGYLGTSTRQASEAKEGHSAVRRVGSHVRVPTPLLMSAHGLLVRARLY